jgi:hypothetical protein
LVVGRFEDFCSSFVRVDIFEGLLDPLIDFLGPFVNVFQFANVLHPRLWLGIGRGYSSASSLSSGRLRSLISQFFLPFDRNAPRKSVTFVTYCVNPSAGGRFTIS